MGDQPVARPLPAHKTAQTHNKRTQTSMPRMGFEPTIPMFEREKTVHALDRAATLIGFHPPHSLKIYSCQVHHTVTLDMSSKGRLSEKCPSAYIIRLFYPSDI
jgi:hypothetical protein